MLLSFLSFSMPMELIPEAEWQANIDKLKAETVPATKEQLKEALVNAIKSHIPQEKFGIFFSGGVDSSFIALICKQAQADFVCYSVGMENAPDLQWAEKVAQALDLDWKKKEFTLEEAEALFKRTAKIWDSPDVLKLGVGSVEAAVCEMAKEDSIKILFGGLGSEEIFAGYERHAKADDKHAECWQGLKSMWKRDLVRYIPLMNYFSMTAQTPFLDENLIKTAMGIDISKKISAEQKKIILREIAEELGLPKEFAWRKKQAAQYGSWFDKALEKLAKKAGMHKTAYAKSLI